jgi:dynein heavy chain
VLEEVYSPLLRHPANSVGWGEVNTRNINESIMKLTSDVSIVLGQTKGTTTLPLPPMQDEDEDGETPGQQSKDSIHVLEGAVITWSKQIKVRRVWENGES